MPTLYRYPYGVGYPYPYPYSYPYPYPYPSAWVAPAHVPCERGQVREEVAPPG